MISKFVFIASLLAVAIAGAVDPYSPEAYVPVTRKNGMDFYADFCVIGAGFSGVKSIETLVVEGGVTSWILIEGTDRIGGRVETTTIGTGANAYEVERHAQWLQGNRSMPILSLATEMQPPLQGGHSLWEEYDHYDANGVKRNHGQNSLQRALNRLWDAYDCVYYELAPLIQNGSLPDMSLRDCYSTCGFYPRTAEEYALEAALIGVEWGELSDITSCVNSAQWVAYSFWGDDGDDTPNFITDSRGLSSVAEYILTRKNISLTDSRIHYNTKVYKIDTDTNVIYVKKGPQNRRYQCKMIINTMGIGEIQANLRNKTDLLTPPPPLPVQASIQKYHMAEYRKVFLQYKTKFWGNKAHFTITPRDSGLQVTSWTSLDYPLYYPGSKILLVSHNGPDSNIYINMPDEVYVRKISEELVYVFGQAANFSELTVNGWYVGHDTYDPYLYGTYSNRPPTLSTAEFRTMFAPIKGRYFPSGEAACDLLNGYVVGAYLIGRSNAQRALINFGILNATLVDPEDNECFRPPAGWEP